MKNIIERYIQAYIQEDRYNERLDKGNTRLGVLSLELSLFNFETKLAERAESKVNCVSNYSTFDTDVLPEKLGEDKM